jgi:hypothetical protein
LGFASGIGGSSGLISFGSMVRYLEALFGEANGTGEDRGLLARNIESKVAS